MKSRLLMITSFVFLGLFTIGCSTGEPAPAATAPLTSEPAAPDTEPGDTEPADVTEIKTVRIGVNSNSVSPLTIIEGDTYSGFEIDIATEISNRVYGGQAQIEWVPITSQERWASLAEGKIDMLVRAALHTTSREELVLFSGGYLLSGNSFLVFPERGISSIADIDGKNVAVLSYMVDGLSAAADEFGYTFTPVVVDNLDEAQGSLGFDRAVAIYHDWVALFNIMDKDVHALLTAESLLVPMGVAFSLDQQDLRDEVDTVLKEMIADGTWQSIFDNWFGMEVPWNVDEMFAYPPADR